GGELSFSDLLKVLRDNRVYVYGGTFPAQYTLSFIEAMMTGIPIVAIGRNIVIEKFPHFDYYEVPEIIKNGSNGFIGESITDMRDYVKMLLEDHELAKRIS